jgi:hypothetical protein
MCSFFHLSTITLHLLYSYLFPSNF